MRTFSPKLFIEFVTTFEDAQSVFESNPMPPNYEKYRPFFKDFDMSDEQKDEYIDTLWLIMNSFADQAFGLTSSQQVCEFKPDKVCLPESSLVNFEHSSDITEQAANDNILPEEQRTSRKRTNHE